MKPLSPRKYPIQGRSRHTVDAVIQAAGQVLVAEGLQKTTTHVIAKRAGASVGTLYQYFQVLSLSQLYQYKCFLAKILNYQGCVFHQLK